MPGEKRGAKTWIMTCPNESMMEVYYLRNTYSWLKAKIPEVQGESFIPCELNNGPKFSSTEVGILKKTIKAYGDF